MSSSDIVILIYNVITVLALVSLLYFIYDYFSNFRGGKK